MLERMTQCSKALGVLNAPTVESFPTSDRDSFAQRVLAALILLQGRTRVLAPS
jgi:hypothetical protein